MKPFLKILVLGGVVSLGLKGCNQPSVIENNTPPMLPPYLDVRLSFEKVPNFLKPARLVFDIRFVGDEGKPIVTAKDDTLDYLWIYFIMDGKTQLIDANPDSIWHDQVVVGQNIHLEHSFQVSDTTDDSCCYTNLDACHKIMLVGAFLLAEHTLADLSVKDLMGLSIFTGAEFHYNHRTGSYTIKNPYEQWHSVSPDVEP